MVTGDNIQTAVAIAAECGIFTGGGEAIEGRDFRKLSEEQQYAILPKIQVHKSHTCCLLQTLTYFTSFHFIAISLS